MIAILCEIIIINFYEWKGLHFLDLFWISATIILATHKEESTLNFVMADAILLLAKNYYECDMSVTTLSLFVHI